MSDRADDTEDDADVIGQCPGQCGRAIRMGHVIREGVRSRALLHAGAACAYFKRNDIDTILADSAKLAKA